MVSYSAIVLSVQDSNNSSITGYTNTNKHIIKPALTKDDKTLEYNEKITQVTTNGSSS